MRPLHLVRLLAVGASLISIPATAAAAPITFLFTGTYSTDTVLPPYNFAGSTIAGSFTFESTTPDANADPTIGDYQNAVTALSGAVTGASGFSFSATGGDILVENNATASLRDRYLVDVFAADGLTDTLAGYIATRFQLSMGPVPGGPTFLTSDALPLTPPALFGAPITFLSFSGEKIEYTLTSVTEVPEPASLTLLGLGLAATALRARRRRP